ncbi:MarR family transcriptional regulator [Asticcacaulis sp. EMRT-3]|uniref:MarR family winged helix-turn-helix transcriptional regulator n=1 Tax=Asticcacaulis sp. EMRT-3 TaxID=3040349 RepID=UPI0024AEFA7E|nr:MarR family transcriptional regulator [Asticcacaulis sp. EMRT-3]MDI7776638.1 MarR family transcriptional regulator [Asticcacaulis sp. EMRT-3]
MSAPEDELKTELKTERAGPAGQPQIIMDALRRIVQSLRHASARHERDSGLTSAQVFLLKTLHARPGGSVNDLAAAAHTHQSTVSEIVARLEGKGLIARRAAPNDRRRVELRLTPQGEQSIATGGHTPQEALLAAIAVLPDAQRTALAEGLSALIATAGLDGETPHLFFESQETP